MVHETCYLNLLPDELVWLVVEAGLDPIDFVALRSSCRQMRRCLSGGHVERMLFLGKLDIASIFRETEGDHEIVEAINSQCWESIMNLGRLDVMKVPTSNRHGQQDLFEIELLRLVNTYDVNRPTQSGNFHLLRTLLRNPRNQQVLLEKYTSDRRHLTDNGLRPYLPMAPILLSFLHLLFEPYEPVCPFFGKVDVWMCQYEAYTFESTLFCELEDLNTSVMNGRGVRKLLYITQLFRYHLVHAVSVSGLAYAYKSLRPHERPSGWTCEAIASPAEGVIYHWRGSSGSMAYKGIQFLHTLNNRPSMASCLGDRYLSLCSEIITGDPEIDMDFEELFLTCPKQSVCWPEIFDNMLPVLPEGDRGPLVGNAFYNIKTGSNYPLVGNMRSGGEIYLLKGHISESYIEVLGGHGQTFARRVAFVACLCPSNRLKEISLEHPSLELINGIHDLNDLCFTYEGLVTPGATMMLGQYRRVEEETLEWNSTTASVHVPRGPFMFWYVRDDRSQE